MYLNNHRWELIMRQSTNVRASVYALTLLLVLYGGASFPLEGQGVSQPAQIASKIVPAFDVEGLDILDALLQLGRQAETPLGIEYLNPADLDKPVTLHVKDTSVANIVQAVLARRTAYAWTVDGGVIHIGHPGLPSGERNVLDHVLSEFTTAGRTDLVTAATVMLPGQLRRQENPPRQPSGVTGMVGSIIGARPEDQVGPLTMHNVTVRQVLNRLVSEGNRGAWVVLVPPAQLGRLPAKAAWCVIAYDDPRRGWGRFVATLSGQDWQRKSGPENK